ncbi:hypothetical protein D918_00297 [Trichuris suis]|nr:hypothetical protein D918_00297 [Trichuris suis]
MGSLLKRCALKAFIDCPMVFEDHPTLWSPSCDGKNAHKGTILNEATEQQAMRNLRQRVNGASDVIGKNKRKQETIYGGNNFCKLKLDCLTDDYANLQRRNEKPKTA